MLENQTKMLRLACMLLLPCAGLACQGNRDAHERDAGADSGEESPAGSVTTPGFCSRDDEDAVRDVFCGDDPPHVRSLSELQELLGVNPHAPNPTAPYVGDPLNDNPFAAVGSVNVMGHSTALSGHLVSPINP